MTTARRTHANCDDCGMNADATGGMTPGLNLIIENHVESTGHTVSVWPHGKRDETFKVRPVSDDG